MPRISAAGENAAVNGLTAVCTYGSMHTGDPAATGANEETTAGTGYARQAETYGAASGGVASNTGALSYAIPATTTYSGAGNWTAVTAGTYEIGANLNSSITTGSSAGTVTVAIGAATITGS